MNDAILNDLKGLEVDLVKPSSLKLNDFATDLSFNQSNEGSAELYNSSEVKYE